MKVFNLKKIRLFVLTCLMLLAAFFGATLLTPNTQVASASVSLNPDTYKTAGSSVRLFDKNGDTLAQRRGIRFHVLLEKSLYEAYSADENFVSYTVVLPKSILGAADLGYNTPKAVKIETTGYWEESKNDASYMESIAYIYNLPATKHATDLCFRGIFSTDGGATWKQTDVGVNSMANVAKSARDDANENWTSTQVETLEYYIPTYEFTYSVNGVNTTETVEYGETLEKIPTLEENAFWWHEEGNGEVAVPETAMFENVGGTDTTNIQLTSTKASTFILTGVNYRNDGFEVYATLDAAKFANGITLNSENIDMVKADGTVVTAKSVSMLVEGSGVDARSRIIIAFDYSQIQNGDTLTILKSSQFYYNGSLYELESDYTFEYNNKAWELPLGEISMGDIKEIVNYTEGSGANTEYNIRVFFREDFLVNGSATLSGNVYVTRVGGAVEKINGGNYYWNQGAVKILELPESNDIWGKDNGDVLTIEAGTRLVQNNGYYVFKDTVTATFNGRDLWVLSYEEVKITADEFVSAATRTENGKIYIEVQTKTRWIDKTEAVKAVINEGNLTYHNTDNVTEINPNEIYYHSENNNQLLRIHLDAMSVTGDWVTIPAGTQFWLGDKIYILTEKIISYYVYETIGQAGHWLTNPVVNSFTNGDINSVAFNTDDNVNYTIRYVTKTSWSDYGWNRIVVDDTYIEGDGVICTGTHYDRLFYHGAGNSLLEIQGVDFGATGGSITLKAGTFLWLFRNDNGVFKTAYRVEDDITIDITGGNGSAIAKSNELAKVNMSDIVHYYNDGSNNGEVRFVLNEVKVTGVYGYAEIDGSVTLNGKPTTSAFIYGGDGTNGYKGGTIIAFTGTKFGGAFQGMSRGDKIVVAAGTKLMLQDGSGYIEIEDEWIYVYDADGRDPEYQNGHNTYAVSFNTSNAVVTVNGSSVSNVAVQTGDRVTFTFEIANGTSLIAVNGATPNGDGTYTTDYIFQNTTVTITAAKAIELGANSASNIQVYSEGVYTGVRINLDEGKHAQLSEMATNGHYGMTMTGTISITVGGVPTSVIADNPFNFFSGGHGSLLEIRFPTAGLRVGDTFTIKAGTSFSHANMSYMLKFTEDFVGYWDGSSWGANPTKLGELNGAKISRMINYSDMDGNTPLNYGVRIFLNEEWFDGVFKSLTVSGNVTMNGVAYTGSWYYYGGGNNILALTDWKYKAGDVLVIEAGTKIFLDRSYYEVTETVIAHSASGNNHAEWAWTTNMTKLGEIDWSIIGNAYSYSDYANNQAINYTIRMNLTEALFGGVTFGKTLFAMDGSVTLNGAAYTGSFTYHGGANMIFQLDDWNYKQGDVLVIAAGTKICSPNGYYLVTKTLTATCTANGTGKAWTVSVS